MPGTACRVSGWLARRYYRANEECSRSRAYRFGIPLLLCLLTLFVVWWAYRFGTPLRTVLLVTHLTSLWAFHALSCYTKLRGRAVTLVGSLVPVTVILFVAWNLLGLLDVVLDLES